MAAAQVGQVDERIRKAQIVNPSAGTVLVTLCARRRSRAAGPAALQDRRPRAGRSARLRHRDAARVGARRPAGACHDRRRQRAQTLDGTVSWVSAQAEFTPTPIQTRDERADLVYAMKIRVANPNGLLKIGMPVDVAFGPAGPARTMNAVAVEASRQAIWRDARARRRLVHGRAGRAVRLHRSGRRRQDDAVPHPGDADRAGRGARHGARPRRRERPLGDPLARRLHARALLALSRSQRGGEPRVLRVRLRHDDRRAIRAASRRSTRSSSRSRRGARPRSPAA